MIKNRGHHPYPPTSAFHPYQSPRRVWAALILGVFTLLNGSCGAASSRGTSDQSLLLVQPQDLQPAQLMQGERLSVVASTSIVGDVVANVGGEYFELEILIPRGTDPHAYQPTPGNLQDLYQADLILLNGFDLEAPLDDILGPVSHGVPVISLSDGLAPRTLEGNGQGDDPHTAGPDPHVWFDPNLVFHWVGRIEQALAHLDQDHAAAYTENAGVYLAELSALDSWIEAQVSIIPINRRKLVLDHLILGYFADRYAFEIVSALVPAFSSAAEPSPRELAELSGILRDEGVQAIFIGVDTNPRLAGQIAGDAGIDVVQLYTGSLGPVDGPAATYLEMMKYNVLAIIDALDQEY